MAAGSFQGGADNRRTSREGYPVNPREGDRAPIFACWERFAGARSHPMQPCAAIAVLVSVREDVLRLLRLWALLGA